MTDKVPDQFTGWAATTKAEGDTPFALKKVDYKPKGWTEDDIDIKIDVCGICMSDLHTLRSGWGPTNYPAVVGHEIVGTAVRVGSNVKHVKVGDRVGVGAHSGACWNCSECKDGYANYCDNAVGTYDSKWSDGTPSKGGYANYTRVDGRHVLNIPENMKSEDVAPLLCAGITTYFPLVEDHQWVGPGKKVGVVGIGGLGHLGVQFAAALGAEVTAISSSSKKKADAEKMGAKYLLDTSNPEDVKKHALYFDYILCTSFQNDIPLDELYLPMLKKRGKFTIVGLPEGKFAAMQGFVFVFNGVQFGGSMIGPPHKIDEMLKFAAKHGIKSWSEVRPMDEANKALQEMKDGKARYRFVLKN